MNIKNDRSFKFCHIRHLAGECVLHSITIVQTGKLHLCDLKISGKLIEGQIVKKIEAKYADSYTGVWSDQVASAIEQFDVKKQELSAHFNEQRLVSCSRELSCDGKKKYRTPDYADKRCEEFKNRLGEEMNFYFCNYCYCYHLGHIPFWLKESAEDLKMVFE